jgi:hypothetical protein
MLELNKTIVVTTRGNVVMGSCNFELSPRVTER